VDLFRHSLNGWQRLGVVASVLWAIGAGIAERVAQVDHSYSHFSTSMSLICPMARKSAEDSFASSDVLAAQEAGTAAFTRCMKSSLDTSNEMRSWGSLRGQAGFSILAVSTLPVIAGWLLAYLGIRLTRWVKAGFGNNEQSKLAPSIAPTATTPLFAQPPETQTPEPREPPASAESVGRPTPAWRAPSFWLALSLFLVAVGLIANKLIAQAAGVAPLSNLGEALPAMARHPDAVSSYVAEALGMALPLPLMHIAVMSTFRRLPPATSRRKIFMGWSVAAAMAALLA
jgi:hypothetical protein